MPEGPDVDAIARDACATSPHNPDFAWQLAQRQLTKALSGRDDLDGPARAALREGLEAALEREAARAAKTPAAPVEPAPQRTPPPPEPVRESDIDHLLGDTFSTTFDGSAARLDYLEGVARSRLDALFKTAGTSFFDRQALRRHFARGLADIRSDMMAGWKSTGGGDTAG